MSKAEMFGLIAPRAREGRLHKGFARWRGDVSPIIEEFMTVKEIMEG